MYHRSAHAELTFDDIVPGNMLGNYRYMLSSLVIACDSIDFDLAQESEDPLFVKYMHFTTLTKFQNNPMKVEQIWYRADDAIRLYDLFIY